MNTELSIPALQAQSPLKWLTRDARHFQIAYLGIFLLYGIFALGWEAQIAAYSVIISVALVTQAIAISLTTKNYTSLKSALITALGLCLLCKANSLFTLGFAASVAIASKFTLRYKGKHLFNPANFGIILAILLTGDAWVSPGQWGNEVILLFMMGAAALIVLLKVGRIDTSLAFLISFGGCLFIQNVVYKGWPLDHWLHSLSSGTLLLFAFFMITDPVTTPNAPKARWIWGMLVGLVAFILTSWFYLHTAPIWALIIISPLTVFFDRKFQHTRFHW